MTSSPLRTVVVPGLGLDARSWAGVAERLAPAGTDVLHLPGMGRAAVVPDLDSLADEVVRRLGDGPVLLAGHSQGCQVAAAVAARDARVVAVVLVGPTTDPRLRSARGLVGRWLATAVREGWRYAPLILAQWWSTGPRAMTALWRQVSPDRIEHRLRDVSVPLVVVRGTRDALCDARWAATVTAAAPSGRLVEVPGAAHMVPMTHAGALTDVLRPLRADRY